MRKLILCLWLCGCGSQTVVTPFTDSGNDASQDSAEDAGVDSNEDAGADGEVDPDFGQDAESDAGGFDCTETTMPSFGVNRGDTYDHWFDVGGDGVGSRGIRVWPPNIDFNSERRFRVLYVQDGQNLFLDQDSTFGVAWRLQDAVANATEEWLIVGIDNTPSRFDDYTPTVDQDIGAGGNGDAYADYLVDVVVPFIEQTYPVQCGREFRVIGGSSLGGLISLHTVMRHPDAFDGLFAMSPSLWWDNEELLGRLENFAGEWPAKIWIDGGTDESARLTDGSTRLVQQLRRVGALLRASGKTVGTDFVWLEDVHGDHTEASWARRVHDVIPFVLDRADLAPCLAQHSTVSPYRIGFLGNLVTGVANATTFKNDCGFTTPNDLIQIGNVTNASFSSDGSVTPTAQGDVTLEFGGIGETPIPATIPAVASDVALLTFRVFTPMPHWYPDGIFVSGSEFPLGTWDGAGLELRPRSPVEWIGTIAVPNGSTIEFKATRGGFETVEKAADGSEIADRAWFVNGDSEVPIVVERWADQ